MRKLGIIALLGLVAFSAVSASAESFDWSKCKEDITKFNCAGKDDEGTWKCLQDNDANLSATCGEAHEAYEKKTGKA